MRAFKPNALHQAVGGSIAAWMRAACLWGMTACLVGCASGAPVAPTYTQAELRAQCQRQTGYWKADDLRGDGFCEFRGP